MIGYDTIQKHRKGLEKKVQAYRTILISMDKLAAAQTRFDQAQQKLNDELRRLQTTAQGIVSELESLDVRNVRTFDAFRTNLLSYIKGQDVDLNTEPLPAVMEKMTDRVEAEHRAWLDKLAKNMPAELKPGMVLWDTKTGEAYEITSDAFKSESPAKRGDDAIIYKVKTYVKGQFKTDSRASKAELKKKGMKYVPEGLARAGAS